MMTSSQATEVEEDDDAVEIESADELYCNMRSNVVGVQYYPGMLMRAPDLNTSDAL